MEKSRRTALLAWLLSFALSALGSAQPVRAGADFQVNAYTTGSQRAPRVATLRDGGFVTVWHSDGQDGSSYGVFGRRYDGSGAPLGSEFQANTYTTGRQYGPLVAGDRKGNFVVVWESDAQDGNQYGVFAQRYDAAGARAGAEFQVNTFTTGYQAATDAAYDAAGNFVVVWTSTDQDGDLASVQGQRFGAAGNRLGAEFQVNSATIGSQVAPWIGMAPSGSFVVVWVTPDGSSYGIGGQRFDANGARVGGEFLVNAATTGDQRSAQVRMAESGAFVVTWRESDGAGFGAFGQRFDAAANPVGGRFQVNTYTTGNQSSPALGMDAMGNFVVTWLGAPTGGGIGLGGRRFRADGTPRDLDFVVSAYTTGSQTTSAVAADDVGNIVAVWTDGSARDGDGLGIFAQRFGGLRPSALAVDPTGNNVLQPGETAQVRPAWTNRNGAAQAFAGALAAFTGPAGGTYSLLDGAGDYGTVPDGATATCTDCYFVSVAAANRPAVHWDASVIESLTPDAQGQQKRWLLHVGDSFLDVPISSPFYRFIETLLHNGITGGCAADTYCPGSSTTRQQMAVFALVGRERTSYLPPACVPPNLFADVPETSPFCRWIEELANRGVVGGCGGGNYCPTAPVTREQMAIFMLRTLDPALSPPACAPPNIYADVPETSPFCRWIEELTNRGVVGGCGGGNYCPTAGVTREQMGVFITATFGLTLYGP